jgi:hypothetical protein
MTSGEDSDHDGGVSDYITTVEDVRQDDYPLTQSEHRHSSSRMLIRSEPNSTDSDPEVTFKKKQYSTGKKSKEILYLREKLCELQRQYRSDRGLLSNEQLRQLQHSPTNVVDPLMIDTAVEKEYVSRAIGKLIQKIDDVTAVRKKRSSKRMKEAEGTPSPPHLEPEITLNTYLTCFQISADCCRLHPCSITFDATTGRRVGVHEK